MDENELTAGQAALNAAGSFTKQMAPVSATAALTQLLSVNAERRAQERYERNQKLLYEYQQQAQKNAALNQVEGLRRAGLSPSLASGAQGMATTAASMPQTNPSAPAPNPQSALLNTAALQQAAAAEDSAASADLKKEQERGVRLQNDNLEGANYTYAAAYDQVLDNAIADAQAAGDYQSANFYQELKLSNRDLVKSKGDFDALVAVSNYYSSSPSVLANRVNSLFQRDVGERMLRDKRIATAVAFKPVMDNNLLAAKYQEAVSMSLKLKSDAKANEALLPKLEAEVEQIAQAIATDKALQQKLIAEAELTHNSDVQTLMKQGDWKGVAFNAIEGGVHWIGDTSKGAIVAASGAATGGIVKSVVQKGAEQVFDQSQKISSGSSQTSEKVLKNYRAQQNRKTFGTSEAPKSIIINGKAYTLDKSGNYHPYKSRSRSR